MSCCCWCLCLRLAFARLVTSLRCCTCSTLPSLSLSFSKIASRILFRLSSVEKWGCCCRNSKLLRALSAPGEVDSGGGGGEGLGDGGHTDTDTHYQSGTIYHPILSCVSELNATPPFARSCAAEPGVSLCSAFLVRLELLLLLLLITLYIITIFSLLDGREIILNIHLFLPASLCSEYVLENWLAKCVCVCLCC